MLTMILALVLVTAAAASVCEQNYHLQTATQFILEGESATTMARKGEAVKVDKSMSNLNVLSPSTEYMLMTDFEAKGTCSAYVNRKVNYAISKKGQKNFLPSQLDFFLKINDGQFPFKNPGWDEYWFGIANVKGDTVTIYDAVGKKHAEPLMYIWYGNATLALTYKTVSPSGAIKIDSTANGAYPELLSYPDSAALVGVLLNGWKKYVKSPTLDVLLTVQLIKITFDSVPSPVSNFKIANPKPESGFQSLQMGKLVLIHPGLNKAGLSEPLNIYTMMGNKIATVHPTGYAYQWNGKATSGSEAPTGVYFVQIGNRTLGKFFYSH